MASTPIARAAANRTSYNPPGVEKGVTGKEKRFQQNRQFGPGAFKPYLSEPPNPTRGRMGNGVYYGRGTGGAAGGRPGVVNT
jgi:hypothetical protein